MEIGRAFRDRKTYKSSLSSVEKYSVQASQLQNEVEINGLWKTLGSYSNIPKSRQSESGHLKIQNHSNTHRYVPVVSYLVRSCHEKPFRQGMNLKSVK